LLKAPLPNISSIKTAIPMEESGKIPNELLKNTEPASVENPAE